MDIRYVDLELTPHLKDMAVDVSIVDGVPYYIDDRLQYDPIINKYFRSLPSSNTPSRKTWKTYSEQLSIFMRFLHANNKHWLEVKKEDLRDYYAVRRLSPSGHLKSKEPISPSSWNLAIAAIVSLYDWALEEDLIERLPFTRKKAGSYFGNGKISEKERAYRKPIQSIRLKEYRESFIPALEAKRNYQRDVSLAHFLVSTGCRISEALSIEDHRLPDPDSDKYAGLLAVPFRIIGKGNKPRQIKLPKKLIREIRVYIREDRADVIEKWEVKHPNVKPSSKHYPKKIWLSERGTKLSANSVNKFFMDASLLSGLDVHPHTLRHTFAVYQLSALVKQTVMDIQSNQINALKLKQMMRDPLRSLQKLMGHSDITTTYHYLDYLEEEEAYVDSALDFWTSEVFEDY